jgi:Endoribonuclease L-PSP
VSLENVIRTRMFVTDISRFGEAARAHKEFFGDFPPATSMVEVRRLVSPDMLIEIEADAYAGSAEKATPVRAPMPEAATAKKSLTPSKPKAVPVAKKKPAAKSVAKKPSSKKPGRKR